MVETTFPDGKIKVIWCIIIKITHPSGKVETILENKNDKSFHKKKYWNLLLYLLTQR